MTVVLWQRTAKEVIDTPSTSPGRWGGGGGGEEEQRGYKGFQVTMMIEWGQKSKPKKIPRKPKKTSCRISEAKIISRKDYM